MNVARANILLFLVMLLGAPLTTAAQSLTAATDDRTYGTSGLVSHTLQAFAFTASTPAATYANDAFGNRYCTGTVDCEFIAPVSLPAGAQIVWFQLDGCDGSTEDGVHAELFRSVSVNALQSLASIDTNALPTPGCTQVTEVLNPFQTINNIAEVYWMRVTLYRAVGATLPLSPATRLRAMWSAEGSPSAKPCASRAWSCSTSPSASSCSPAPLA